MRLARMNSSSRVSAGGGEGCAMADRAHASAATIASSATRERAAPLTPADALQRQDADHPLAGLSRKAQRRRRGASGSASASLSVAVWGVSPLRVPVRPKPSNRLRPASTLASVRGVTAMSITLSATTGPSERLSTLVRKPEIFVFVLVREVGGDRLLEVGAQGCPVDLAFDGGVVAGLDRGAELPGSGRRPREIAEPEQQRHENEQLAHGWEAQRPPPVTCRLVSIQDQFLSSSVPM